MKNWKQTTFDQYHMFEWTPEIPIMYDMTENKDEDLDEENEKVHLTENVAREFME